MSTCSVEAIEVKYNFRDKMYWAIRDLKWKAKAKVARLALDVLLWLAKDSNYIKYAKTEMHRAWGDEAQEEGPNKWVHDGTLELLAVLDTQGHSGGSIHYSLNLFKHLALFTPIAPLTGADDEWSDVSQFGGKNDLPYWQNKIKPSVFKQQRPDGTFHVYDIDGYVFEDVKNGSCWGGSGCAKDVEFPYTPQKPVIIKCSYDENNNHTVLPGQEDIYKPSDFSYAATVDIEKPDAKSSEQVSS